MKVTFSLTPPDYKKVIDIFLKGSAQIAKSAWGQSLRKMAITPGSGTAVSATLCNYLRAKGIRAQLATLTAAHDPAWEHKLSAAGANGHVVVHVIEPDVYVDLCARQFDPAMPEVRYSTRAELLREWHGVM